MTRFGTAVVVGASMAGLCAARVLSERFDRVVVLDRDALPRGSESRDRVPQGRHPHLLLAAGAQLLEGWFPGLLRELEAGGAVPMDICRDFAWHQSGGLQRRPASGLRGPSMSRPFLEATVRQRVRSLPGITVLERTTVAGLTVAADRVTGVRLEDGTETPAALVVDASGRQARSLPWLAELGYEPPPTSVVAVDTRYVTRVFRRTDRPNRDWVAAAVIDEPARKRNAMALPIEGDCWLLTFQGLNGESPPAAGDAEMLSYGRSFPSPLVAALIENSEPLGEAVTHRFPSNQRRRVERLRHFPCGWIMLGDAVCSFDPIYGQGMTSAALQADALGKCLDRADAIDRRFARSYFRAAAKAVQAPWSIAVGGDFSYPDTKGDKPFGTDVLNRYFDRITIAAQHDDAVVIRMNEVLCLTRGSEALLTPPFVLRVLRHSRRRHSSVKAVVSPGVATS